MPTKIFKAKVSEFRFEGVRINSIVKQLIIRAHNKAVGAWLITVSQIVPQFTGKTQSAFREVQWEMRKQGAYITLKDFPKQDIFKKQYSFPREWEIPRKIKEVIKRDSKEGDFKLSIYPGTYKFSINFEFKTDYYTLVEGGLDDTKWHALETAKARYKAIFSNELRNLFLDDDSLLVKSFKQMFGKNARRIVL
jgi:hypothetical protein